MLNRNYDPNLPYRAAKYLRMSDPGQNPRSPDQQSDTVDETAQRLRYPWHFLRSYRDDGISGRLVRRRPQFQQMLFDIAQGLLVVDLIAVDTYQRLGRADEVSEIRRKLFNQHGVLVVAADKNFADPTGFAGKAMSMMESFQATEEGKTKAHDVIRGKKDTARRKRWPGGPCPFGYELKTIVDESGPRPDVYSIPVPHEKEGPIVTLVLERAFQTGHGSIRLSKWANANPMIPDDIKPIKDSTIDYWLQNEIYAGVLLHNRSTTEIVDDVRVVEENPDEEVVRVEDFCKPLIDPEKFRHIQAVRSARAEAMEAARRRQKEPKKSGEKLLEPLSPGLVLTYPLTGLCRCGHCGASMRPTPSGRKGRRRYAYYHCPTSLSDACNNRRYLPEPELRKLVFDQIRSWLLSTSADGLPNWYVHAAADIRQAVSEHSELNPERRAAVQLEIDECEPLIKGWARTLADPNIPSAVRADICERYRATELRKEELQATLCGEEALLALVERGIDKKRVLECMARLETILGGDNATLINLELTRHIDRIECSSDRRITIRGTWLGMFEGIVQLLRFWNRENHRESSQCMTGMVKPRRRGKLRVDTLSAQGKDLVGDLDTALDPERFVGLPDEFFWIETVALHCKLPWAQEHAAEVARLRMQNWTISKLADYFGKTPPTIRSALSYASKMEEFADKLPAKLHPPRWHEVHAADVAAKKAEGMTTMQLAKYFDKSDTTIRKALKHHQKLSRESNEDSQTSE